MGTAQGGAPGVDRQVAERSAGWTAFWGGLLGQWTQAPPAGGCRGSVLRQEIPGGCASWRAWKGAGGGLWGLGWEPLTNLALVSAQDSGQKRLVQGVCGSRSCCWG